MGKINDMREQRAKTWEQAKAFLDARRNEKGILSVEDRNTYERMEAEIVDLGAEIDRQERIEAYERELNAQVGRPITSRPETAAKGEKKTGRASDEYRQAFWNHLRRRENDPMLRNALQVGTDSEGGYLVPDEFEHTLIEALDEENIFRSIARIIQTASGDRKIPISASKGEAAWIDEEGAYPESDDSFGQVSISAYKLGTIIKVSEELINDSVFDIEGYIAREYARRIGAKEEAACFTGNGSGKPLGILAANGGAQVGVTAASVAAITCDEVIDLYHSLRSPYRKNAVWLTNDSTIKALRKLKDGNGQYIWQPSLAAGTPDTILSRPV
ncbi:MAG: phage major capsid protein, partial [Spirochaetia bacterium]|nr:phage major capsid protein [Spirochaetia bacterium]